MYSPHLILRKYIVIVLKSSGKVVANLFATIKIVVLKTAAIVAATLVAETILGKIVVLKTAAINCELKLVATLKNNFVLKSSGVKL
jgi:hypothetical protein